MIDGKILIEKLIVYAQTFLGLNELDVIYERNTLLNLFKLSSPTNEVVNKEEIASLEVPDTLIEEIMTYALENGIADDEIVREVTVNASKPSACTKHSLHKIKAVKATCQEPGIKAHYECSVCHKIFSDKKGKKETTLAKLATKKAKHVFKKKNVSDEYLKSPATCTKKATYYYACKTCGEKGKKTFTAGKALGHKYEQAITKATPAKNGSIGQKCTVCGKKGKGKVIPRASKIAIVKKYKKKGVPASVIAAGGNYIEVKNSKGKKISKSEYDIAFNNDIEAGKGSATVTFMGTNYEGTKTINYRIAK